MKFVDEARIRVEAGAGGDGCLSFRREKFIPFGGPNGDGGDGGHVVLEVAEGLNTLVEFRYKRRFCAQNGHAGMGKDCSGHAGADCIVRVPAGTVVYDADSDELLGDLVAPKQRLVVARGGVHGMGNTRFKSSTNRAPRKITHGQPGDARNLRIELKLLADVGLMGMPNAGKSSLIRAVSAARPKVAGYPFTTLYPHLGVVRVDIDRSFVIADVPGLIEGAGEGAGLGVRFLKHLARTRLLLHVVDIGTPDRVEDIVARIRAVEEEIGKFSDQLYARERWLVLNKVDLLAGADRKACASGIVAAVKWTGPVFEVSALSGEGCPALVYAIQTRLDALLPIGASRGIRATMSAGPERTDLGASRRWVVKIGSSLATNDGAGLRAESLGVWVAQMAVLCRQGREIVVVTSGAVAEGVVRLGWASRPHALHELQAAAAIGQMGLIQTYEACFQRHGLHTAQVLLTHADLAHRQRYLNARSTLRTLLALRVVPVVNENDTVATEEIRVGDNDTLAGLVANLIEATLLVILTDQEGFYESDPRVDPQARLIGRACAGDPALTAVAGEGARLGRGGMRTKLTAAALAARSGTATIIASGHTPEVLLGIAAGAEMGTLLVPGQGPLAARKQWLAGGLKPRGCLLLDAGAARVLLKAGRSLLAVGVTAVEGDFGRGELVSCVDPDGREIARGLINYSALETARIRGQPSDRIEAVLGYVDEPELIHRDNLVVL